MNFLNSWFPHKHAKKGGQERGYIPENICGNGDDPILTIKICTIKNAEFTLPTPTEINFNLLQQMLVTE